MSSSPFDRDDRRPLSRPVDFGGNALFLAERAIRRWSTYYREIADLTREGSAEPRLWIGCVEDLWSGLADDYGDYLRRLMGADGASGGGPLHAPSSEFRFVDDIEGTSVQELALEVPGSLFEPASVTRVALSTLGMWKNGDRVLQPGVHLAFTPPEVGREGRTSKLRFHDLPADLYAGTTLVGTVVGQAFEGDGRTRPPELVAVVQVRFA